MQQPEVTSDSLTPADEVERWTVMKAHCLEQTLWCRKKLFERNKPNSLTHRYTIINLRTHTRPIITISWGLHLTGQNTEPAAARGKQFGYNLQPFLFLTASYLGSLLLFLPVGQLLFICLYTVKMTTAVLVSFKQIFNMTKIDWIYFYCNCKIT